MNDILRGNFDPNSGLSQQGDDNRVFAEFYMRPVVDGVATKEAGRTITKDVPHIKIIQPGESQHSVYNQPATNQDTQRFPKQWAAFQAGQSQEVIGSPLSLLFPQSPATVENLKHCGVRTIEQLAGANDTALQGMGMGARSFQEKAKQYLDQADKGKNFHDLSDRLDGMEFKLKEKDDRIAALEQALAAATEKRGPGRPRKESEAA